MATSAISADLKKVPIIVGGKPRMSNGKTAVQTNPATGEAVDDVGGSAFSSIILFEFFSCEFSLSRRQA